MKARRSYLTRKFNRNISCSDVKVNVVSYHAPRLGSTLLRSGRSDGAKAGWCWSRMYC